MENERARQLLETARGVRNPVIELRERKLRGQVANDNASVRQQSGVYARVTLGKAGAK